MGGVEGFEKYKIICPPYRYVPATKFPPIGGVPAYTYSKR